MAKKKKVVVKKSVPKRSTRAMNNELVPCICIKKIKYWYCMKQLPDGSLIQCDGPFKTEAICIAHFCQ